MISCQYITSLYDYFFIISSTRSIPILNYLFCGCSEGSILKGIEVAFRIGCSICLEAVLIVLIRVDFYTVLAELNLF